METNTLWEKKLTINKILDANQKSAKEFLTPWEKKELNDIVVKNEISWKEYEFIKRVFQRHKNSLLDDAREKLDATLKIIENSNLETQARDDALKLWVNKFYPLFALEIMQSITDLGLDAKIAYNRSDSLPAKFPTIMTQFRLQQVNLGEILSITGNNAKDIAKKMWDLGWLKDPDEEQKIALLSIYKLFKNIENQNIIKQFQRDSVLTYERGKEVPHPLSNDAEYYFEQMDISIAMEYLFAGLGKSITNRPILEMGRLLLDIKKWTINGEDAVVKLGDRIVESMSNNSEEIIASAFVEENLDILNPGNNCDDKILITIFNGLIPIDVNGEETYLKKFEKSHPEEVLAVRKFLEFTKQNVELKEALNPQKIGLPDETTLLRETQWKTEKLIEKMSPSDKMEMHTILKEVQKRSPDKNQNIFLSLHLLSFFDEKDIISDEDSKKMSGDIWEIMRTKILWELSEADFSDLSKLNFLWQRDAAAFKFMLEKEWIDPKNLITTGAIEAYKRWHKALVYYIDKLPGWGNWEIWAYLFVGLILWKLASLPYWLYMRFKWAGRLWKTRLGKTGRFFFQPEWAKNEYILENTNANESPQKIKENNILRSLNTELATLQRNFETQISPTSPSNTACIQNINSCLEDLRSINPNHPIIQKISNQINPTTGSITLDIQHALDIQDNVQQALKTKADNTRRVGRK